MICPLIGYKSIAKELDLSTPAAVRQYFDENNIPYKTDNRGRPWTTLTAVDQHLGVDKPEAINRDIVI